MSDTPRTDAAISFGHVVDTDFARELERELNEAKKSPWKSIYEISDYTRLVFYRHEFEAGLFLYGVDLVGHCPRDSEYMEIPE